MHHHTVEAGSLAHALALLAEHEAELFAELARLRAAAADGDHAELIEAALAPLGFHGRRMTVLGCAEDLVLLRRPGDAPPCILLFQTGAPGLPGQLAACLAALRAAAAGGLPLAFTPGILLVPEGGWPGVRALAASGEIGDELACFDGVAVPRVWPGCFGVLEALIRVRGRASHPGVPGQGVNAIEAGVPVLQALLALGQAVARRTIGLAHAEPDAPLRARLTLSAAHGGQRGSSIATVFDVLVNRRYTPSERYEDVVAELRATADAALAASALGMELQVTHHLPPAPDPLGARRPRAEAALSFALGWPHEVLRVGPAKEDPDGAEAGLHAALLGGVGRAGEADARAGALAQARAILAYLAAEFRPQRPA